MSRCVVSNVFLVAGCYEQVNDTGVGLLAERAMMQSGRICIIDVFWLSCGNMCLVDIMCAKIFVLDRVFLIFVELRDHVIDVWLSCGIMSSMSGWAAGSCHLCLLVELRDHVIDVWLTSFVQKSLCLIASSTFCRAAGSCHRCMVELRDHVIDVWLGCGIMSSMSG